MGEHGCAAPTTSIPASVEQNADLSVALYKMRSLVSTKALVAVTAPAVTASSCDMDAVDKYMKTSDLKNDATPCFESNCMGASSQHEAQCCGMNCALSATKAKFPGCASFVDLAAEQARAQHGCAAPTTPIPASVVQHTDLTVAVDKMRSLVSSKALVAVTAPAVTAGSCDMDAVDKYMKTSDLKNDAMPCFESNCMAASNQHEAQCCGMNCALSATTAKFPGCASFVDLAVEQARAQHGCAAPTT